jgi:Immunity protein family (Imm11)
MVSGRGSERLECSQAFELGEGYEGLGPGSRGLRVRSRELLGNDVALARGEEQPSDPIEFVRDEGRTPHDLIGTTYATLVLVSERFLAVLREHGFSGWTTFPVTVSLDDGSELESYRGFAVTGRCGAIDDSLSEEVVLPAPAPGGRARPGLRGLCFPPESWDGSDIFTAEGYAGIFVVEAVKEALEEAAVTNVDFRRLSEIERIWRADRSVIEAE